MSIEGIQFCDMCGGAISLHEVAPVRVAESGHLVQLHLHNRHADDCLARKLSELAEQYAMGDSRSPFRIKPENKCVQLCRIRGLHKGLEQSRLPPRHAQSEVLVGQ